VTLEEGERLHIRRALATGGRLYGNDGAAALLGVNLARCAPA
jgi:hypothetical protein